MRDIDYFQCGVGVGGELATVQVPKSKAYAAPGDNNINSLLLVRQVGISDYLSVSRSVTVALLDEWQITPLIGGQYDYRDLWAQLWGIRSVPSAAISVMRAPLLCVTDLAAMAGVSARTIRRAGDTRNARWQLPRHVDLGPRARRYLGPLVDAWAMQIPPEPWLTPPPRRPILGGGMTLKSASSTALPGTNGRLKI